MAALAVLVAMLGMVMPSMASAQSLPVTCTSFSDHPIQPQVTVIRALYFTELRTCIDDLRALWSLGGYSWSGPIVAGQTWIQAVHVQELRSALNAVYVAASATPPSYADPVLIAQSSIIRAVHVNDLRTTSLNAPLPQVSLAPPTIGPTAGAYNAAVSVTLSAPAGATIRYTTDGTTPTASSPIYSGSVTVSTSTTVKARAFKTGFLDSAEASASYLIDQTAPTITAMFSPQPNAAGWNNTDVTVTFVCADAGAGVASCPAAVTLTEGVGQVVVGTVTDAAGNQATQEVTVNIDRAAAAVTLDAPPVSTTDTAVSLVAEVADASSGVASASCNGVPATITNGQVACSVALQPGRNAVIVHALDRAGNSYSFGAHVTRSGTPTSLAVTPSQTTIAVGESRSAVATSEFGPIDSGVSWLSDDETVVDVTQNGVLTGVAPGEAIVTATLGGLSAQLHVVVVADATALQSGAVRWTVPSLPGATAPTSMIQAAPRTSETSPLLFAVEDLGQSTSLVRAIGDDGRAQWSEVVAGQPLFGDTAGGIVSFAVGSSGHALIRSGGTHPWRYDSAGWISRWAQASDGTIFVVESIEHVEDVWDDFVVSLDGDNGATLARVQLPRSTRRYPNGNPTGNACISDLPVGKTYVAGGWHEVVVGGDGAFYLMSTSTETTHTVTCVPYDCTEMMCEIPEESGPGYGQWATVERLVTMRVTRTGSVTSQALAERTLSGADTVAMLASYNSVGPGSLASALATEGGAVFTWTAARADWVPDPAQPGQGSWDDEWSEQHVSYVTPGGVTDHVVAAAAMAPALLDHQSVFLVGDANTAYVGYDDGTVSAVDVPSWGTKWTMAVSPSVPLPDGGLLSIAGDGFLETIAVDGVRTATTMPGDAVDGRIQVALGLWAGVSPDGVDAVVGPAVNEAVFSFQAYQGNASKQNAPRSWYESEDLAARAALEYLYPNSEYSGWEWGGLICRRSDNRFVWSPFVTTADSGQVNPLGNYPNEPSICGAKTVVASFHTHPPSWGQPYPSGFRGLETNNADTRKAEAYPDLTFFLKTPQVDRSRRHVWRYRAVPTGDAQRPFLSLNNVFLWSENSWQNVPYNNGEGVP